MVGNADVARLALPDDVLHGAHRLLDRRQRVGLVELVEVDPVRLQPLEARLDGLHRIAARTERRRARAGRPAEFGGEHDVLAPFAEAFADETLRSAAVSVALGCIEERDAAVDRLVDDSARARKIKPAAEIVAAEPDNRDAQAGAPEIPEFHCDLPLEALRYWTSSRAIVQSELAQPAQRAIRYSCFAGRAHANFDRRAPIRRPAGAAAR